MTEKTRELYQRWGPREDPPDNYFGLLPFREARAEKYADYATTNLYPGEGHKL